MGTKQPDEDTYNFKVLDAMINGLFDKGIYTCLGTSTAVHPAWMAENYPDVSNICRTNGRQISGAIQGPPAVLAWHIFNEYGVMILASEMLRDL